MLEEQVGVSAQTPMQVSVRVEADPPVEQTDAGQKCPRRPVQLARVLISRAKGRLRMAALDPSRALRQAAGGFGAPYPPDEPSLCAGAGSWASRQRSWSRPAPGVDETRLMGGGSPSLGLRGADRLE
jgi:hypothetical protein